MQALRDFWAKSLLNKLIVVAAVGLLCCCPVSLAGRGGRSTATTAAPTVAANAEQVAVAQVADAATTTPDPAETPTLTERPALPTATPELAGPNLGIDQSRLRSTFSAFGFRFEPSPLQDGIPRLLGTGPGNTLLELTGPADALTSVGLIAAFPDGDDEAAGRVGTYMGTIVGTVAPDQVQATTDWVVGQLQAAARGEDVTDSTLDTGMVRSTVTIIRANDGMVITYSIDPIAR